MYRRLEMSEYEEVQFVGVYVLQWRSEWGQPTEMFREATDDEMLEAARQLPEVKALTSALLSAQTALDHVAPGDCWATGPSTGDSVQDLIVCPGCAALAKIEAALAGLLFGEENTPEIECAVCDNLTQGGHYGWYSLCTEHLKMATNINSSPDNFQATVIVGGLRHKIRQDATRERLMAGVEHG